MFLFFVFLILQQINKKKGFGSISEVLLRGNPNIFGAGFPGLVCGLYNETTTYMARRLFHCDGNPPVIYTAKKQNRNPLIVSA